MKLGESIHGLIIDMDGVLWRGTQRIVDFPIVFDLISDKGWKVILATNNATLTTNQYLEKIRGFGATLEPWQVINSAEATAHYLKNQYPCGGTVFVVGEQGLVKSLQAQGFHNGDKNPLAVVVGLDRQLNFEKLQQATLLVRQGVPFIGTNPDRSFPTPEGLIPGAGAILAAIEAASDEKPVIIGKPFPTLYRQALERLGAAPEEILVIGDRLDTDIAGGQSLGCKTALVLSGVSTSKDAQNWKPVPDIIAPDLMSMFDKL